MLLTILTLVLMALVGYAYYREGLFTSCLMFLNVFFAGLVAFNFWEPLAELLESPLSGTFVHGYEDAFCLVALFCITLGALRGLTNYLANIQLAFPPIVQRGGGALFGVATGYLVAGFLLCVLQTLPWHVNFMSFDPTYDTDSATSIRQFLPPDRVWLGLMYRAGAFGFATAEEDNRPETEQFPDTSEYYKKHFTFDKFGSFEVRYERYRRYTDTRDPLTYSGEFDNELGRTPQQ
jgi:hypothetical protein